MTHMSLGILAFLEPSVKLTHIKATEMLQGLTLLNSAFQIIHNFIESINLNMAFPHWTFSYIIIIRMALIASVMSTNNLEINFLFVKVTI